MENNGDNEERIEQNGNSLRHNQDMKMLLISNKNLVRYCGKHNVNVK